MTVSRVSDSSRLSTDATVDLQTIRQLAGDPSLPLPGIGSPRYWPGPSIGNQMMVSTLMIGQRGWLSVFQAVMR